MKLWAILTTMFVLMIASINAGGVELQDADSLRIVSKTARYHTGKNYVDFHGDVHADNGEAKLTCENMKVYFDEQDQVKKIICSGNVIIRKEQSTSYSDHANYSAKDSKVTLVGNAKVVHVNEEGKKSMTNGNVIIYYLVKEMIEVHDSELDIQNK